MPRFFGKFKRIELEKKMLSSETYNQLSDAGINWLHGSSSILLSTLIQTGLKELMPSGVLKDPTQTGLPFPLFPISATCDTGTFDLNGTRKNSINTYALSGCSFNKEGIDLVLNYASSKEIIPLSDRFDKFKSCLGSLEENTDVLNSRGIYKRQMKLTLISLHHAMVCYPEWESFKEKFLEVIKQAKTSIENSSTIVQYNKLLIMKYLNKMENTILNKEISFTPNEIFYQQIKCAFPIVIAANLQPDKFRSVDSFDGKIEKSFEGNISLFDIKFILTPEENKNQLQMLVEELKLPCSILTYQVKKKQKDVYLPDYEEVREFTPMSSEIFENNSPPNRITYINEEEDYFLKLEKQFNSM